MPEAVAQFPDALGALRAGIRQTLDRTLVGSSNGSERHRCRDQEACRRAPRLHRQAAGFGQWCRRAASAIRYSRKMDAPP